MFRLIPTGRDRGTMRHFYRQFLAGRREGVVYRNTPFTEAITERSSQIRRRPVLMTEEQKASVRSATGFSPYLDIVWVPVHRGRARSQTRRATK